MSTASSANHPVNANALKSEIRSAIITAKSNACPMIVRLAWHSSGTFDKNDGSGGSNGAGMRFEPESTDDANAGLNIVRDMLLPVKTAHPELSNADIWVAAGCAAVEFSGGPKITPTFGRTDFPSGSMCPANGRLPDAAQGAQHLRDVFYRMGFNDQEIVALSGAHTLGRCHASRSGFDGPWTNNALKFDNEYFKLLLNSTWQPRKWDGPLQYEDAETQVLMMLPTDLCLIQDPAFKPFVELYANDEQKFFADFALVFDKLVKNGTSLPALPQASEAEKISREFRENAMHGSLHLMKKFKEKGADVHSIELNSLRTSLHKAAFWGHSHIVPYLVDECKLNINAQDSAGDTALHDAARFGHTTVVDQLIAAGADASIKNKKGQDVSALAAEYQKMEISKKTNNTARL